MGSLKQDRGHEEGRTQVKSRGKSKAASVNALEPHVAMLKTLMSAAQDILDSSEVRVDGLDGRVWRIYDSHQGPHSRPNRLSPRGLSSIS